MKSQRILNKKKVLLFDVQELFKIKVKYTKKKKIQN